MRGANRAITAGALLALLLASIAGCDPVRGLADAGPGDDDAGATTPDASVEPGTVAVTVYDGFDVPLEGARVLFHDPAGELVGDEITGSNGRAQAELPPRSFVTVATTEETGTETNYLLRTIVGVMPNDEIEIGPRRPAFSGERLGQLELEFLTGPDGNDSFDARVGCDSVNFFGTGIYTMDVFDTECTGGFEPVDLVATVRDNEYQPVGYAVRLSVDLDTGAPLLFNTWQTNFAYAGVRAYNAPPLMISVRPELRVLRRGLDYGLHEPNTQQISEGGEVSFAIPFPPAFAQRLQPSVMGMFSESGDPSQISGFSFVSIAGPASAPDFEVDLTAELLPRVSDVSLQLTGGDRGINMMIHGDYSGITAFGAGASWSEMRSGQYYEWQWDIIAAPDIGPPIPLPPIPDDVFIDPVTDQPDWPPPLDSTSEPPGAGLLQVPVDDWSVFRQNRGFDFFEDPLPADAPDGATVRFSVGGISGS